MSHTSNIVFTALKVVAWIIFVALCIEAGALLVNFVYSIFKPEIVAHLYQKLDLSDLYEQSQSAYYGMYSFILFIAILKAALFYVVIALVSKFDLAKPFNEFVSKKISTISYYALSIGLISHIGRQLAKNMEHHGIDTNNLNPFWADSQAFILMAAVIYIIATIFKKGIEIQTENDLTV